MDETVVTREGLARLSEELERLKRVERRGVAEEYRIAALARKLRSARLVESQPGNGRVDVGERVDVRDLVSGERLELELVGTLESDPDAGRISVVSPVGKAIVGLRRGQVVDVETPIGRRRFKVLEVEPPPRAA
jgi:transcription elongation factor GreA